jgi:hypothetical protein
MDIKMPIVPRRIFLRRSIIFSKEEFWIKTLVGVELSGQDRLFIGPRGIHRSEVCHFAFIPAKFKDDGKR